MDQSNLAKLKQELIRDEGISSHAYQDSVGLWTIGVGHLLGETKRIVELTSFEIECLLDGDIKVAEATARIYVPELGQLSLITGLSTIGSSRERALINMTFNLGFRLSGFKNFLTAVKCHDWEMAAKEMMNSKWAKQVGARAERLRDMILTED